MRENENIFAREIAPNVHVSSTARIPNKIKLRKKLKLWPIKISAGLDYSVFAARDKLKWVASCKVSERKTRHHSLPCSLSLTLVLDAYVSGKLVLTNTSGLD